jgi:hypothetical protein
MVWLVGATSDDPSASLLTGMRKGVERKAEKAAFELSSRRGGSRSW